MNKNTSRAVRAAAVVAMGGAAVFAGSGTGAAAPIDFQPIPVLCPAGIAETQSLTHTENDAVEGDEVSMSSTSRVSAAGQCPGSTSTPE